MVSSKVEIISKSYTDEQAIHWVNDGSSAFELEESDKKERGTEIILHITDEDKEFLDENRINQIITKYCNFLPYPIKLNDKVVNDQHPLWLKPAKDITDEEYKEFYRKLFPMELEPLFWIHLDVEVPFRLKGILYFPKIRHELDSSKGRIKLFCNQVFVADNAKEIIPEFLTLLQGALDIPELPLNVSRSYLQNDPYVKKISEHITKKVSDKLNSIYKKEKENYEKFWEDINIFVKFGILNDEKFYEKMKDIIIFKSTDGVYKTLPEYLEKNKGINKEKNGKQTVLYASNEEEQITYINYIKAHGMEALVLGSIIDVHFIQFLEMKNNNVTFIRVDSDIDEHLADEKAESKIVDENNKTTDDKLKEIFEKNLNNEKNKTTVKVQPLKNNDITGMIVLSEFMRRFKEMSFNFTRDSKDMDGFSEHTLIVNSNNESVKSLLTLNENSENEGRVKDVVNQIYDLALLSQNQLKGERLAQFIARTNSML